MNLIDFISYSSILMFVLYIISVNFFTKANTNKVQGRPPIQPFTFFKKAKNGQMSVEKAIELIEKSAQKK
ncbi:MAG: hypothetical protein ACOVO2_21005 [Emticicia sp.]|uniref:hypothetical protein n=1 Tax=Emticicia sp. TaxID=1930953 RepID=UPI003BA41942